MYYGGTYTVKSVTRTGDGETFDASQHISSGLAKYRHIVTFISYRAQH